MKHTIMMTGMGNVGARFDAFIALAQATAQTYTAEMGSTALRAAKWYSAGDSHAWLHAPTEFKGVARFRRSVFAAAQFGIEHDVMTLAAYPSSNILRERNIFFPGDNTIARLAEHNLVSPLVHEAFKQSSRTLFGEPASPTFFLFLQMMVLEKPLVHLNMGDHERFLWNTGHRWARYPGERWNAIRRADEHDRRREEIRDKALSALAQRVDHDETVLAQLQESFAAEMPLTVHPRYLLDGLMVGKEEGTFVAPRRGERPTTLEISPELQERMVNLIAERDQLAASLEGARASR